MLNSEEWGISLTWEAERTQSQRRAKKLSRLSPPLTCCSMAIGSNPQNLGSPSIAGAASACLLDHFLQKSDPWSFRVQMLKSWSKLAVIQVKPRFREGPEGLGSRLRLKLLKCQMTNEMKELRNPKIFLFIVGTFRLFGSGRFGKSLPKTKLNLLI